jgi:hypothetical protein
VQSRDHYWRWFSPPNTGSSKRKFLCFGITTCRCRSSFPSKVKQFITAVQIQSILNICDVTQTFTQGITCLFRWSWWVLWKELTIMFSFSLKVKKVSWGCAVLYLTKYTVMTESLYGMNRRITKKVVLFWYSRSKHGRSIFCHVLGLLSLLTTGKSKQSAFRSHTMSYAVSRRPITA